MKKTALALTITLTLLLSASAGTKHPETVQASTDVIGIITSNTTWTKANSPYNLTGSILVSNGVELTILAGVTVNLNGYVIMVNDTLTAGGSGNS